MENNKRKTSKSKRTDTTDDDHRRRRKRKPGPATRALKLYYAQKQPKSLQALQKKEPTFEHKFDATFEHKVDIGNTLVTPRVPDVNLSTALNLKVVCAAPQKKKKRRHEPTDVPETARIDLTEEEDPRAYR